METCAHELCFCTKPYSPQVRALSTAPLDPNAQFCSKRCEEMAAGTPGDDNCECGHAQCTGNADTGIPPMQ